MATEAQIYDYESAIEAAIKAVLVAVEIAAYTPADDPELERERPRVELRVSTGPATRHLQPVNYEGMAGRLVYDAFDAMLMVSVITKANHAEHAAYRAAVRAEMARIIYLDLDYHEINDITPAGSTPTMMPQEGIYETKLNYSMHFCIKHDAWPTA